MVTVKYVDYRLLQRRKLKFLIISTTDSPPLMSYGILAFTYLPKPLLYCSPIATLDITIWTSCCSLNKPYFLCPLHFFFLECFPHYVCLLKSTFECTSLLKVKFCTHPLVEALPILTTICTSRKAFILCPCIVYISVVV